ncbi:hypothetical protein WCLP8_1460009 [uncultured Gammaproteobacteria bacterium]
MAVTMAVTGGVFYSLMNFVGLMSFRHVAYSLILSHDGKQTRASVRRQVPKDTWERLATRLAAARAGCMSAGVWRGGLRASCCC